MSFLNKLAKNMRDSSLSKFIAITGSSGKTTVKNMIGNALRVYKRHISHQILTIITMASL